MAINAGSAYIDLYPDGSRWQQRVRRIVERTPPAEIEVEIDTAAARARIDAFVAQHHTITVDVDVDTSSLRGLGTSISNAFNSAGTSAGGFGSLLRTLPGGLTAVKLAAAALSPVLLGLVGSLGLASAALASIGPAAIGAVGGFHALFSAFSGILKVQKNYKAAQEATIRAGGASKAATEAQVKQLEDLKRAAIEAGKAQEQASRGVLSAAARAAEVARDPTASAQERLAAAQALQDAQDAANKAARDKVNADKDLVAAQNKSTDAVDGGSSSLNAYEDSLADLTDEGRAFYKEFRAISDFLDTEFRQRMERAILPGFTSLLKALRSRGGGKSLLDIYADGAEALGRSLGRTAEKAGQVIKQPFFKKAFADIMKDNEKAFDNVGDAAVKLIEPISRIFRAASPLIVRFSGYLDKVAGRFADIIADVTDAELAGFFKSAGDELAKWWDIATDLGGILLDVMRASFPAGSELVETIGEFTKKVKEFTGSKDGQEKIEGFFTKIVDFVKNFDYVTFGKFVEGAVALGIAIKGFSILKSSNPIFLLLSAFAVTYPKETAEFMQSVAESLIGVIKWASDNPAAITALLGLLAAYKGLKAIAGFKFPTPGTGGLTGFFGGRGSTALNPIYAHIVNLPLGGLGGPGAPTGPTPVPVPPAGGGAKEWFKKWGGRLLRVAGNVLLVDIGFNLLGSSLEEEVTGLFTEAPWVEGSAANKDLKSFQRWLSHDLPGLFLEPEKGEKGWSGFWQGLKEDLGIKGKEAGKVAGTATASGYVNGFQGSNVGSQILSSTDWSYVGGQAGAQTGTGYASGFKSVPIKSPLNDEAFLDFGKRAGKGSAQGFATGWRNNEAQIHTTIQNTLEKLKTDTGLTLKLTSPSKVFAEYGSDTALGFAVGWDRSAPRALAAVDRFMSQLAGIGTNLSPVRGAYGAGDGASALAPGGSTKTVNANFYGQINDPVDVDMIVSKLSFASARL